MNVTYQKIRQGYGHEELDKHIEDVIERLIAVKSKNAKVDVAAAQRSFQHGETYGDALQLQWIHSLFWHLHVQNVTPCKTTVHLMGMNAGRDGKW